VAADSTSRVRYTSVGVIRTSSKCNVTASISASHRKDFSRVDPTGKPIPHQSAAVQWVLCNKLYVDNYCTKEQLRIRHSKWELFRQLQATGLHPLFDGEQEKFVYHYPVGSNFGSKDPTLYTE
jgi:hypothetical protein